MSGAESFICKAFKGTAIVLYCKYLITQQMEVSPLINNINLDCEWFGGFHLQGI